MKSQEPELSPQIGIASAEAIAAVGERLMEATVEYMASIDDPGVQAGLVHSFTDKLIEKGVPVPDQLAPEMTDKELIHDSPDARRGPRTRLTRAQLIARRTLLPSRKVAAVERLQRLQALEQSIRNHKDQVDS